MHRTTTATVLLATALTLAGCSTPSGSSGKPTPSASTSAPDAASAVDQVAACTDAIAAGKDKGDGAPECASLSTDDYFKALQAANRRAQASFQACTDDPSTCPTDR